LQEGIKSPSGFSATNAACYQVSFLAPNTTFSVQDISDRSISFNEADSAAISKSPSPFLETRYNRRFVRCVRIFCFVISTMAAENGTTNGKTTGVDKDDLVMPVSTSNAIGRALMLTF